MSRTGPDFDPYSRPANSPYVSPSAPPPSSGYAPQNRPIARGAWPPVAPPKGLAIASLVCGISGVLLPFGIPSMLAVIFGHSALSKVRHGTGSGRELALAGLITGYVMIGLIFIFILVVSAST